jgi:hypothetical protein
VQLFLEVVGPILFIVTGGLLFPYYRKNNLALAIACSLLAGGSWLTGKEFYEWIMRQTAEQHRLTTNNPVLTADEIFWLTIKDSAASGLFEEFLTKYPKSNHVAEARERIEGLRKRAPTPPTVEMGNPPPATVSQRKCAIFNGREVCG